MDDQPRGLRVEHSLPFLTDLTFDVIGLPSPQGSKTRMPNGAMLDGRSKGARDRHRDWRSAVANEARHVADSIGGTLDCEMELSVIFRFPMPKSRPKRVRAEGSVAKTTSPDLDKLIRAVGDGLTTGGLIADDARLARIYASKLEVVGWTGAIVTLSFQTKNQPEGDTAHE